MKSIFGIGMLNSKIVFKGFRSTNPFKKIFKCWKIISQNLHSDSSCMQQVGWWNWWWAPRSLLCGAWDTSLRTALSRENWLLPPHCIGCNPSCPNFLMLTSEYCFCGYESYWITITGFLHFFSGLGFVESTFFIPKATRAPHLGPIHRPHRPPLWKLSNRTSQQTLVIQIRRYFPSKDVLFHQHGFIAILEVLFLPQCSFISCSVWLPVIYYFINTPNQCSGDKRRCEMFIDGNGETEMDVAMETRHTNISNFFRRR